MAKVTSPLWGMTADGQIGKSVVFARWKGVRYARRYTVGANPNTLAQQEVRGTFKWLADLYRYAPSTFRDPWELRVKGEPLTAVNMFIKQNLAYLRGETDLANLAVSVPVAGGMPPLSGTITGGAGQITISMDAPPLPTGWSVSKLVGVVLPDQVPSGAFSGIVSVGTDSTAPYSVQITGLSAGVYYAGAYFAYLRDDGALAYGAPLADLVTVT